MDNVNRHRREVWLPVFSVAIVAIAGLAAVLLPARQKVEQQVSPSRISAGVVTAPPLRPPTQAMGAAAACENCGVVENVVAVHGRAKGKVEAVGFLMSIRMWDPLESTCRHASLSIL